MKKVLVEIKTDRITAITVYLDEILKQMKNNKYFSILNYKIEQKNEKAE